MKREEILKKYKVDEHGIIISPGKFEGEKFYAPYFYDLSLESSVDETLYYGDIQIDIFIISEEDVKEFPELKDTYAIILFVSDQGFVYLKHFETKEDFEEAMEQFEEEQQDYEEED